MQGPEAQLDTDTTFWPLLYKELLMGKLMGPLLTTLFPLHCSELCAAVSAGKAKHSTMTS